jgi:protein phosphatase
VWDVRAGAATDVGCVRQVNEDGWYAGCRIFVVADGMGGHAAGDVASSLTLGVFSALDSGDVTRETIRNAVRRANDAVVSYADSHPGAVGLGTTVAGIAMVEDPVDHWVVFHVGDSRVYAFEDGVLTQLTIDHSEVAEMVGAGLLTPEEAASHPSRNIITRAVGEWPAPEVEMLLLPRSPGRRLLVCSDGLTGEVGDAEVVARLAAPSSAQQAADSLVQTALANGGSDNVTVVVIDEPTERTEALAVSQTVPRHTSGGSE